MGLYRRKGSPLDYIFVVFNKKVVSRGFSYLHLAPLPFIPEGILETE